MMKFQLTSALAILAAVSLTVAQDALTVDTPCVLPSSFRFFFVYARCFVDHISKDLRLSNANMC